MLALLLPNREAKLMALAVLAGLLALTVVQLRSGDEARQAGEDAP